MKTMSGHINTGAKREENPDASSSLLSTTESLSPAASGLGPPPNQLQGASPQLHIRVKSFDSSGST